MVWCDFTATDGSALSLEAKVDNTFDSLSWQELEKSAKVDQWLDNTGSGSHVEHYNKKARSSKQAAAIENKTASPRAKARILDSVKTAMANER